MRCQFWLPVSLLYFAELRGLLSRSAWHSCVHDVFRLAFLSICGLSITFGPMGFTYLLAQLIIFAYWFSDPTSRKQRWFGENLFMEWWTGTFCLRRNGHFSSCPQVCSQLIQWTQFKSKHFARVFRGHSVASIVPIQLTFLEPNNHHKNVWSHTSLLQNNGYGGLGYFAPLSHVPAWLSG